MNNSHSLTLALVYQIQMNIYFSSQKQTCFLNSKVNLNSSQTLFSSILVIYFLAFHPYQMVISKMWYSLSKAFL